MMRGCLAVVMFVLLMAGAAASPAFALALFIVWVLLILFRYLGRRFS